MVSTDLTSSYPSSQLAFGSQVRSLELGEVRAPVDKAAELTSSHPSAGLLALIGIWAANGTPRYQNASANVAYISNVGAYHQTLFICICVVTSFFVRLLSFSSRSMWFRRSILRPTTFDLCPQYIASLLSERYLRHVDRIPSHGSRNKREVVYGASLSLSSPSSS